MLRSNAFIFAFVQGFHIQYSYGIIRHYMSIILQTPPQAEPAPTHNILENIHRIMLLEFQALQSKLENHPPLFKTFLMMANQTHMELLWRFQQVFSKNSIKVYIRPNLSQSVGHNFKAETQRIFVDLLKVINKCNKERSKSMNFIISDFSYIEVCTSFLTNQVVDCVLLRKLIKSTILQLPQAILKLLTQLRPFLEERNLYGNNENISDPHRMFIERGSKLLSLIRLNQLKNQDQTKKQKENGRNCIDQREIEQKLEIDRVETHRKLKDCLKMLGFSQSYLKNQPSSALPIYHEWMNRFKQEPKKKLNKLKNVHGIRIIKQDNLSIERSLQGSHCKIVLSKFQVLMMVSVNAETNYALQAMKKTDGTPLISQKIIKIQKQLELVKKLLKNPDKKQSKNSFQNELEFILYIKERGFKYISTYYWQFQKKRTQMQTILANYYPHNLKQMLHTQGKFISVREKLALLQQIISAVNWLANNYVCHRDIKPDNIMIDEHKTPKIIDFGSCCPVYGVGNDHFRVTQTRLLGTPYYHHAYNEEVSKYYKRNQYQQHLLFDAYSLGKVMRDIFDEGLPNLMPNLQGILNYMIERCLEPNPGRRITYQQLLFVFDNFIHYLDWWMGDSARQYQTKAYSFPLRA